MKTKAKKFSHKLLALFLAVVMALTCFTGVITAYGQSIHTLRDEDIEYNDLAWSVLSDAQVATALLDYLDNDVLPMLKDLEPTIANAINGNKDINSYLKYNLGARKITVLGGLGGEFSIKLGSINELLETIESVNGWLNSGIVDMIKSNFGDVANIDLDATNGMRRGRTDDLDIIRGVFGLIQENTADYSNKNKESIVYNLLVGTFTLGSLDGAVNIYGILGNLLGLESGYQSNFVYNLVQSVLFNYTEWFTDEEILAYKGGGTLKLPGGVTKEVAAKTFVYDEVLLEKLTDELLKKISVLVTYPDGTSSASRKEAIDALVEGGKTYKDAAESLGYDPNLVYSTQKGMENNILLFEYGNEKITLDSSDSLFSFGYQALSMAWKTVLKDTVKLIHVNYNVDRNHGSNFDNQYYYWASENITWDKTNPAEMYSAANVEAWANAVYADYSAESAEQFLEWVKDTYVHDRTVAEDAEGKWSDIDSTTLFNKMRYSPLADYYFNMQTGPINLYFMQLGTPNLDNFFDKEYSGYSSLVAGINDCLVAAVKDLFPDRANIYKDAVGDTARPEMSKTNDVNTKTDDGIRTITSTLVNNALSMVQYVADTTDKNILNGFYMNGGTKLTEKNLEGAMIPLLISCLGNINLGGGRLDKMIHHADWDACKDAEAIAFVCLREYLSYVIPSNDYDKLVTRGTDADKTIHATLEGTILPMARDAVVYVAQGFVPITDSNGDIWKAEDPNHSNADFLDLLNSVICYYADYYTFKDGRDDDAMAAAPLLGLCNEDGTSKITKNNTLWKNVDEAVDRYFPLLATLQGTEDGKFDSEDLIWNDVVLGILEIGDTSIHSSGMGGVSNFIYRLLTIISSAPIQTDTVVRTAYNVVKDLLNGLFGPRYSGQTYVPVPENADSKHPFDDLVQAKNLVGYRVSNKKIAPGALLKVICNVTEFVGYGSTKGEKTYPDTVLPGAAFLFTAVNSFITLFPGLAEHQLKMATATFADPVVQGCQLNTATVSTLDIKNNATGLNVAYVDGIQGKVVQLTRYYIKVKSATLEGSNINSSLSSPSSTPIAPGETMSLTSSTYYTPNGEEDTSPYIATVTYDICDKNGNLILDKSGNPIGENLTTNGYQVLTSTVSWKDVVYPEDRWSDTYGVYQFPTALEVSNMKWESQNVVREKDGFTTKTTYFFGFENNGYNRLYAGYPTDVVLSTDNLSAVDTYGVRIYNIKPNINNTNPKNIEGIYYYDNKIVYDDITGGDVSVGQDNAIPVIDKTNGNILKIGLYDVSYDSGKTWDTNSSAGYTSEDVDTKRKDLTTEQAKVFTTRTHVAHTLQEAIDANAVAAYHVNDRGVYEYVYLKRSTGDFAYSTLFSNISVRGPIDGFYYNGSTKGVTAGSSIYIPFLTYDGSTPVSNVDMTANVCFYNGLLSAVAEIHFVVCDTSSEGSVTSQANELSTILSNYKASDFTNYDAYIAAQEAIINAMSATALPITPDTASKLADNTELTYVRATSTTQYGETAYTPLTTTQYNALTDKVKEMLYYNDSNGLYYFDSQFVAPVYSTTALKTATGGKDKAGMAVVQNPENKVWYNKNTVQYEKKWDTETYQPYPYLADTKVQATNHDGTLLYNQIQWKYFNEKGMQTTSGGNWVIKVPVTSYQIVPNSGDVENRGIYTANKDNLKYVLELVYDSIDTSMAKTLYDKVSTVRANINSTNFEVVTYNKMLKMAKTIENKYSMIVTYQKAAVDEAGTIVKDAEGNVVFDDKLYVDEIRFDAYDGYKTNKNINITKTEFNTTLSSTQIAEYVRLFNEFMDHVVERGYQGKQIEAEILCASGNAYNKLTATPATYDESGEVVTEAVVGKTASSAAPAYGAWSADGTLVNEGETVYTDESWNAYVTALAKAVSIAQTGNGSYAYKDKAYYQADKAENYTAQISDCYNADTALQYAEINLEPVPPVVNINVSGKIVVATDVTGTSYTTGIGGINIYLGDEVVATSAADGTFTAVVPVGTTELKIAGDTTIDRTVTLSGDADVTDAVIPIVICDYNRDGNVNPADMVTFGSAFGGTYNIYCDFNVDGNVNPADMVIFSGFFGKTVAYNALAIA